MTLENLLNQLYNTHEGISYYNRKKSDFIIKKINFFRKIANLFGREKNLLEKEEFYTKQYLPKRKEFYINYNIRKYGEIYHFYKKYQLEDVLKELDSRFENSKKKKSTLETRIEMLKEYYAKRISFDKEKNKIQTYEKYLKYFDDFKKLKSWEHRIDYISALTDILPKEMINDLYTLIATNDYVWKKSKKDANFKTKLQRLFNQQTRYKNFKKLDYTDVVNCLNETFSSYIYPFAEFYPDKPKRFKSYDWKKFYGTIEANKLTKEEVNYVYALLLYKYRTKRPKKRKSNKKVSKETETTNESIVKDNKA